MKPEQVLIPTTLQTMLEKILEPFREATNERYAAYAGGWITAKAEKHYRYLTLREHENGNTDQQVARLLCELAIAHALLEWHEEKDKPPPVPHLKNLNRLL